MAAIPQTFISQLLSMCDIEDIVSSYANVKRQGRNKSCLCPFHSEKTPSMVIYNDTQSFYCFGCGVGGDVITFIMKIENLDYVEAVKFLANRVGLQIPEEARDDKTAYLKSRILEINRASARFYYDCLKSDIGKAGYDYFKTRQLSDKTITKYGLGYAPDSWDLLKNHLLGLGFNYEEMYLAGVISKSQRTSRYYDTFRNRVMFPIIDTKGNVIAFGGRVLDNSKPKYLNSADTPVFKKSRNLFSLNFAKNSKSDRMILAEGYMDVIAINAAGFDNVVATLGTALTKEQAKIIGNKAKEVIIAYDSDEAGQTATHRAINLFSDEGIPTKILKLTGAKDPDEYIKKFGVKRFEMLLDGAGDIIEFELNKLKATLDLEDINDKKAYLKGAVSVLSNVTDPLERELYAGIVSKETGIATESIMSQVKSKIKKDSREKQRREWNDIRINKKVLSDRINPQKPKFLKQSLAEEGIIAFLFRNPDYYDYILSKIGVEDCVTDFNKRVFKKLSECISKQGEVTLTALSEDFSSDEKSRIAQILAQSESQRQTKELLDGYIATLTEYNKSLKSKDIAATDIGDIEQYRKNLLKKKSN